MSCSDTEMPSEYPTVVSALGAATAEMKALELSSRSTP